jgi:hypothetical protein
MPGENVLRVCVLTTNELSKPAPPNSVSLFIKNLQESLASKPKNAGKAGSYSLVDLTSGMLVGDDGTVQNTDHRYICAIIDITLPFDDLTGIWPANTVPDIYVTCYQEGFNGYGLHMGDNSPRTPDQFSNCLKNYKSYECMHRRLVGEANLTMTSLADGGRSMFIGVTVFVRNEMDDALCDIHKYERQHDTKSYSTKKHMQINFGLRSKTHERAFQIAVACTHLPMKEDVDDMQYYHRYNMPLRHTHKMAALKKSLEYLKNSCTKRARRTRRILSVRVRVKGIADYTALAEKARAAQIKNEPPSYEKAFLENDMLVSEFFSSLAGHHQKTRKSTDVHTLRIQNLLHEDALEKGAGNVFEDLHAKWVMSGGRLMHPTCEYHPLEEGALQQLEQGRLNHEITSVMNGGQPDKTVSSLFHLSKNMKKNKNTPSYCDRILVQCSRASCCILAGDLNFRIFPHETHPTDGAKFRHKHTTDDRAAATAHTAQCVANETHRIKEYVHKKGRPVLNSLLDIEDTFLSPEWRGKKNEMKKTRPASPSRSKSEEEKLLDNPHVLDWLRFKNKDEDQSGYYTYIYKGGFKDCHAMINQFCVEKLRAMQEEPPTDEWEYVDRKWEDVSAWCREKHPKLYDALVHTNPDVFKSNFDIPPPSRIMAPPTASSMRRAILWAGRVLGHGGGRRKRARMTKVQRGVCSARTVRRRSSARDHQPSNIKK